jgi:hypothetical protein
MIVATLLVIKLTTHLQKTTPNDIRGSAKAIRLFLNSIGWERFSWSRERGSLLVQSYVGASFFAYEAMPIVEAFCKQHDLVVEDP